MADPLPLLSQTDSIHSEALLPTKHDMLSLDDVMEHCTGRLGWTQLLQTMLVSVAWAFEAQQTFISVFAEASPAWQCNAVIDDPESCNLGMNQCHLAKTAWAWNRPETSLVSEWDIACLEPFILGLPTSAFFIGSLMGGLILATLADSSLGRRKMLLVSCLVMTVTSLLTVFAPNFWVYSALRFITGFGRSTLATCALVLATEMVGKRWRGQVGILGFLCFTLGFLSLPAMAYLNKDSSWRALYLWMAILAMVYSVLLYLIVNDSPRWLFVQGRKEEAIRVLKSMMSTDDRLHFENFSANMVSIKKETQNMDLYSGIKILWQKTWASRRLSLIMIAGFGTGVVYYGMPLGVGSLSVNIYLSVMLNAFSELPALLITFFVIDKLNRRSAVFVLMIVSGVCSVMCAMVAKKQLQIGLELVSFFSACTASDVLMIYTLELFPTCVRNSALSVVRQAIVSGGAISPVLVAAGRGNGLLSYGVFGLVIGCCGFFVVRLPETRGGSFCETMDEEERKNIKGPLITVTTAAAGENGV